MDRIAREKEEERLAKLAQQEMIEMMQLQMSNEDEEEEVSEVSKSPSVSSEVERHAEEIRNLTDTIANLEDRIDEYEEVLDMKNEEHIKLGSHIFQDFQNSWSTRMLCGHKPQVSAMEMSSCSVVLCVLE